MAKAQSPRIQTSRASASGTKRSKTGARVSHRRRSGWSRSGLQFAVVAVVVTLGLFTWWIVSSRGHDATAPVAQPIATLDTPDFHSLLVDSQNPEHIVFGSHAGIQESRDGGFSWEDGALRNADAMQLSASPKAPTTLYATGHDVFQISRDGGQTWQRVENNLPGTDIHAFAQDPDDPQRLYAFVVGMGIFTSDDGGTAWSPLTTQPPGGDMPIALAANPTTLYVATQTGLLSSSDGGVTWKTLPEQPGSGVMSLAISAVDTQILYAGTPTGLAKSVDNGATWINLGPSDLPVLALAVAPSDPNRVLFITEGSGVYRSDDGGLTWRTPSKSVLDVPT